ncbi:N-formylglutamate amidohydrolase [Luteimonas kalidii]|uniref:N-formylglutamate amidohydrolase n=1 Tax=Luteimonas kalidii TaxID=3042025 RepID=A0ABT6JR56_9GAMM|nr:N-formylglutamate amidohydrolase [Luteimonas kalidii]MDH5833154.1 N-formylglutamate amidohydrolase [Luteimonas kalidii]
MSRPTATASLLSPDDPPAFTVLHPDGRSPWLLVADHAGQAVPAALARLGLPQAELDRHIGWDIGIAGVTSRLAERLDACAILQTYSRLVIDCNRPLEAPGSIAAVSDGTVVPGNQTLDAGQRAQRVDAIFAPYHARITDELDRRAAQSRPTILVAMHSFTPAMDGTARPWHAGVLYQRDTRLAHALLAALRAEGDLVVGDNEPYSVSDATDYAIPVHGERRGLAHVELEIRQDLIAEAAGQAAWADRLARLFAHLQPEFVTAP